MSTLSKVGTIYFIAPEVSINTRNGKTIKKRELYLSVDVMDSRTNERINTTYLKFVFMDARCSAIDRFKQGDKVAVLFDLDGRFYDSGNRNPDGSVAYRHIQDVRGYNILTMEEYKQRYGGMQESVPVRHDDYAKSLEQSFVAQSSQPQYNQEPNPYSDGFPF